VLSEGGPSFNGALVAAGLVDEVSLSVAPALVGGPSARIAHGPDAVGVERLLLRRVLEDEGYLFLRYARA
jgi:5-amino-6-(5-phosphoribosylamino)uracil reductase